jgi:hypothetical protein
MAKSKLEITVTAKDLASKDLKKLDKGLEEVNKEAKKSSKGIASLGKDMLKMGAVVGGVTAGLVMAGKALFDLGERGAVVEQTGESFEFLIEKLDLAPDLLEQLGDAALGTVDDMTLMSGVATLLAGTSDELGQKLGDATPQLLKIAKAANKLNPQLGDTAFMFESIATGVKRAQPLILDNLGLTIKVGAANEAMAKSLGKSVEELTAEEKAMAILNDTLRAGDLLIAQVGGNVESATDDFARMETVITDLKDELARGYAPALAKAAGGMTKFITTHLDANEIINYANQLVKEKIITDRKALIAVQNVRSGIWELNTAMEYLNSNFVELTGHERAATEVIIELTGHERAYVEVLDELVPALEETIDETERLKLEQQALKDSLDELRLFISGPVGSELDSFNEKQGDLTQEVGELGSKIAELTGLSYLNKKQEEELGKLQTELGKVNKAIDENVKKHDEAQKRIVFNLLTQQAAADGLTETELKGLTEVAKKFGLIDAETARVTGEIAGHLEQLADDDNIYRFGENVTETVDGIGEDTDEVMLHFNEWIEAIAEIEGMHPIEFVVTTTGVIPGGSERITDRPPPTTKPPKAGHPDFPGSGGKHGLDMIVPGGFPNDSYPIWTTSGENVEVTPKGQQPSGDVIINNYFTIADDMDVEEVALDIAEVYRTRME